MNKLLLITAMFLAFGVSVPVHAHEGEAHGSEAGHNQIGQITDGARALKVIQDGVTFMSDAITSKQADLFNDGTTMDKLHEITVRIEEAASFIENQPSQATEVQKSRLVSALKQLTKTVTDFHIATHDRNIEKSLAELKKVQGALKLVEVNFK